MHSRLAERAASLGRTCRSRALGHPGDGLVAQRVDAPTVTAISGPTDVAGVTRTIADRAPAVSNASMPPPVSPSPLSGGPAFTVNGFDVGVTFAPDGLNVSLSKGFLS